MWSFLREKWGFGGFWWKIGGFLWKGLFIEKFESYRLSGAAARTGSLNEKEKRNNRNRKSEGFGIAKNLKKSTTGYHGI